MTDTIHDYDPAAALENEEAIAVFLSDALETGDPSYIAKAMGVVVLDDNNSVRLASTILAGCP